MTADAVRTRPSAARDAGEWARELGISREAVELYLESDVIDLHVDSFIWTRVFGYDLHAPHRSGLLGARYYRQVDFPRLHKSAIGGALWSITTNPLRGAAGRAETFFRNLEAFRTLCGRPSSEVSLARNAADYRAARAAGRHAAFVTIQGGNALDRDLDALSPLRDGSVLAITLMHLSSSRIGGTSSPLSGERGLTDFGRAYVERLNELRVFVDLAHASRKTYFDAVEAHDRSQPLLVSHTGVKGATKSWRNLDDEQLRAVAATGGVVGVIFHGGYLGGSYWTGGSAERIVDHLEHIVRAVGEDHAALGSDWDGAIITPRDLPTCEQLPRLVQRMLDRGLGAGVIQKILGRNFLRALAMLRG